MGILRDLSVLVAFKQHLLAIAPQVIGRVVMGAGRVQIAIGIIKAMPILLVSSFLSSLGFLKGQVFFV